MKKMRIAGVVAVLAGLVGGVGLAPATADSGCADGRVCFWTDINYGGAKYSAPYRNGYVGWMNDQASTFRIGKTVDDRYHYVMFYENAGFWGSRFYAKEFQAFNLTSLAFPGGGSWNDKISSHDEAY
ncbi:peptidase inhibitor family I36 protein [Sinomonas humi]|nr:peptidase inhibitor family I36 protein [Sinomonas humi]